MNTKGKNLTEKITRLNENYDWYTHNYKYNTMNRCLKSLTGNVLCSLHIEALKNELNKRY